MPADVKELLQQGKVQETIQTLTQVLRDHPADTARRTSLFELLCFAGEYTRAEKQLAVLATGSPEKETGSVVYYAALHAEKAGHVFFRAIVLDKIHQQKPALESYQRFLAMSNGQNPNEEFQARQRIKILERELRR